MADNYKRLDNFAVEFLKANGDIKDRSIQRWHLAFDVLASGFLTKISPVHEDIYPDASGAWQVGTQVFPFYQMNSQIMRADYGYFTNLYGTNAYFSTIYGDGSNLTGINSDKIWDTDHDTIVQTEAYPDEDKVRISTEGVDRTVIDSAGLEQKNGDIAVQPGAKVNLEGISGNTYFTYSSSHMNLVVDGTQLVSADETQFGVESDMKLGLKGYGGTTYWKYNTTTAYLEGWVDGIKRVEL